MAIYVVMEPPRDRAGGDEIYVRDGFHWLGFLLPVVWLLWNRLWIETAVLVAVMLGLGLLGDMSGSMEMVVGALSFAIAIYVGLEASALRIWALRRRGYREWGVVEALDREEAELRYLSDARHDERAEERRSVPLMRPSASDASRGTEPELGLFGYPGKA